MSATSPARIPATSPSEFGLRSSSGTEASAFAAGPPAKTGSNSTTSSCDPREGDTRTTTSCASATVATDSCTKASSGSNVSNGDRESSPCSAESSGGSTGEIPDFLEVLTGDALEQLRRVPDKSVHCAVTSPPYFGLRSYLPKDDPAKHLELGQERTVEEYVAHLVEVFREVYRVLRDDGTFWVVIGDTYTKDGGRRKAGKAAGSSDGFVHRGEQPEGLRQEVQRIGGKRLAQKQRLLVPWRLALALQDDGWVLRQDIVWAAPNKMPESVRDRFTQAHEYVLMLAKGGRYFFDQWAVKEPCVSSRYDRKKMAEKRERIHAKHLGAQEGIDATLNAASDKTNVGRKRAVGGEGGLRNPRSVWNIPTVPFKGKHFAVFPPRLAERCILAGTSPWVCGSCGAPQRRVLGEKLAVEGRGSGQLERKFRNVHGGGGEGLAHLGTGVPWNPSVQETVGFEPTCKCHDGMASRPVVPATVLDPFAGAFTTAVVCDRLGRKALMVELNREYARMGVQRVLDERRKAERGRRP